MKSFLTLYLAGGALFLYSSMTCLYNVGANSAVSTVTPADSGVEVHKFANLAGNENNSDKNELNNIGTVSPAIKKPDQTRGIYLSAIMAGSKDQLKKYISDCLTYDINTIVIDIQPRMIPRENLRMVREAGLFPVARLVVFKGGMKKETPDQSYINGILKLMEDASVQGFLEVQLDYIRYADDAYLEKIPLKRKYAAIDAILKRAREQTDRLGMVLSADVFGRVTLNHHDSIGQKLENYQ